MADPLLGFTKVIIRNEDIEFMSKIIELVKSHREKMKTAFTDSVSNPQNYPFMYRRLFPWPKWKFDAEKFKKHFHHEAVYKFCTIRAYELSIFVDGNAQINSQHNHVVYLDDDPFMVYIRNIYEMALLNNELYLSPELSRALRNIREYAQYNPNLSDGL